MRKNYYGKPPIYTTDYVLWLKKRITIKDDKIEELTKELQELRTLQNESKKGKK